MCLWLNEREFTSTHAADASAEAAPAAELIAEGERVGAEIRLGGRTCRVWFGLSGEPSGHVRIVSGEDVVLDRPLTQDVQAQSGVGVASR